MLGLGVCASLRRPGLGTRVREPALCWCLLHGPGYEGHRGAQAAGSVRAGAWAGGWTQALVRRRVRWGHGACVWQCECVRLHVCPDPVSMCEQSGQVPVCTPPGVREV